MDTTLVLAGFRENDSVAKRISGVVYVGRVVLTGLPLVVSLLGALVTF